MFGQSVPLYSNGTEGLWYIPSFTSKEHMHTLLDRIPWQQNTIRIFGKQWPEPRLTAWYGPSYSYSGIRWPEQPLSPELERLLADVSGFCQFPFNACLCNRYRNGMDAMGWHRDNEPEIDQRMIASVSLGAARRFRLKERKGKQTIEVELETGSLLIMAGMQQNWLHSLPRTKKECGERVNLTFRRIKE